MPLEKYFSSLTILLLLFTQICNLTWIVREGHLSSFQLCCSKLALSLRCSMSEVSKGFPAELFDPPAISTCQDWTLSRLTMLVKQQLIPELSRIFRSWILCWYIVFRNMGAASWFMFLCCFMKLNSRVNVFSFVFFLPFFISLSRKPSWIFIGRLGINSTGSFV